MRFVRRMLAVATATCASLVASTAALLAAALTLIAMTVRQRHRIALGAV